MSFLKKIVKKSDPSFGMLTSGDSGKQAKRDARSRGVFQSRFAQAKSRFRK